MSSMGHSTFHHVPFFWIHQTTYISIRRNDIQNDVKFWVWANFFSRDVGITWPKIFLQDNCGSSKYFMGARAGFIRTRLLSIQFHHSLAREEEEVEVRREKLMRRYHETRNVPRECTRNEKLVGKVYFDKKKIDITKGAWNMTYKGPRDLLRVRRLWCRNDTWKSEKKKCKSSCAERCNTFL